MGHPWGLPLASCVRDNLNMLERPLLAGPCSALCGSCPLSTTFLSIPSVPQLLGSFLPQDLGTCSFHSLGGAIHSCLPLILQQLLPYPCHVPAFPWLSCICLKVNGSYLLLFGLSFGCLLHYRESLMQMEPQSSSYLVPFLEQCLALRQ